MEKSYQRVWKSLDKKKLTSVDITTRALLRAFFAKDSNRVSKLDIARSLLAAAFTPIDNYNKISNGQDAFDSLKASLKALNGTLTLYKVNDKGLLGLNSYLDTLQQIFDGSIDDFSDFLTFRTEVSEDLYWNPDRYRKKYYVYIFVFQTDVEPIYQLVQAAHAAIMVGAHMGRDYDPEELYLQVCEIPSPTSRAYEAYIRLATQQFFEPDVGYVIAYATLPIRSNKRGRLLECELLTFDN